MKTSDEIKQTARNDVARNFTPLFNHDLTGADLELYRAEYQAAEAGARHRAYSWAPSRYADPKRQAAYDAEYNKKP